MVKTKNARARLLVLVPNDELDEAKYAKKARSLAEYYHLDIVFLGKTDSSDSELYLRRRLITLAGISRNQDILSTFTTNSRGSWGKLISSRYEPGDYILLPKEMMEIKGLVTQHYIYQELQKKYGGQAIAVIGFLITKQTIHFEKIIFPIINWAGIFAIFVISFGLEANVGSHTFGWIRILGEISLVGVEIFSLLLWNSLTNKG